MSGDYRTLAEAFEEHAAMLESWLLETKEAAERLIDPPADEAHEECELHVVDMEFLGDLLMAFTDDPEPGPLDEDVEYRLMS